MTSPYPSTTNDKSSSSRLGFGVSGDSTNTAISGSPSTVRPRNRRLISTELTSESVGESSGSAPARALSPIPSQHPSRLVSSAAAKNVINGRPVGGMVLSGQGDQSPKFGKAKGLWEGGWTGSWSTLQGLASSLLGGETDDEFGEVSASGHNLLSRSKRRASAVRKAPATWGPSGGLPRRREDSIGTGTIAARSAEVKARKTASVLQNHEGVNSGLDVNGKHKRRTSREDMRGSIGQEDATDALVYIHNVQPSDTLAGVVLKYNCEPAAFRKANRLWPNDAIQIREVVLLPVDACAIRGRPCDPPVEGQYVDLLAPTPATEDSPSVPDYTNGDPWGNQSPYQDALSSRLNDEERPWTHVRWVLLDSSPSARPVEIARLPRKTLGYFPPRRRKSQLSNSLLSTPRSSLDLGNRPSLSRELSGSLSSSPRRLSSLNPDAAREGYFPTTSNVITGSRKASVSESTGRPGWMQGPGGVGTFAKNVRKPGPAQDGLNSWAAKHIPSLSIGYLPSISSSGTETATSFGFRDELAAINEGQAFRSLPGSGTVTPNGGQGIGFEQAAAAIEGWMRRLAARTPGTPILGGGKGPEPEGDLIELLDGAGSDDGRAFETAPSSNTLPTAPLVGTSGREATTGTIRGRLGGGGSSRDKKID